ncbi:ABC transporter permease [Limosilactobacillus fermentum]|uniref:ABC transporter permease n=1 Tax=Limosilactobacillus fermentum TaxID=1613 RepID=UPI003EB8DA5C
MTNAKQANNYLTDGVIDGILTINDDFSKVRYKHDASSKRSNPLTSLTINITALRSQFYASKLGLTPTEWANITKQATIHEETVNRQSTLNINNSQLAQSLSEAIVIVAFFFLISYISIVGVELGAEKGNHLIEGLLAAIPAKKHYTGKMLGICFLIAFQLVLYAVFGLVGFLLLRHSTFVKSLHLNDYLAKIDPQYLWISLILALLSLFLYISLAAYLVSLVSRAEDIGQATSGVTSILLIPYFINFLTQSNPNLIVVKILSYLPFMSQDIMPVRMAQGAASYSAGYVAVAISLLSAVLMYLFAQRTYVNNIFTYRSETPLKYLTNKLLRRN